MISSESARVESTDPVSEPPNRPSVPRILWYAIGGSLPPRYNAWVLHDVTCRTWWVRHFARVLLIVVPLTVANYVLLSSSSSAVRFAGLAFILALVVLSVIFMLIDTDRRAVRAGYPFSLASEMRSRHTVDAQRSANRRRRQRVAARRARR